MAEVAKDTLFGIVDRITSYEDRAIDRNRRSIENQALKSLSIREADEAKSKLLRDSELHALIVENKKIANERARVSLSNEQLQAAAQEVEFFRKIMSLARESGASEDELSRMSAEFIARVQPIAPMIRNGKLLAQPPKDERALLDK